MTDKTTPAFPVHGQHLVTGLTIRDYFAAKAMQAVLAKQDGFDVNDNDFMDVIAYGAYKMADAMLRAREQQ